MPHHPRRVLLLLAALFLSAHPASAATQTLLGPEQFTRTTGSTTVYTRSVTVPPTVVAPYTLHVVNGNPNNAGNRVAIEDAVSSGQVLINGVQVIAPSEFSRTTALIDKTVTLGASNTVEIRLNSAPNSYITVTIAGISSNRAPVADGGPDQAVATGSVVTLDGSASHDPDGQLLTYSWTLTARPAGSVAVLNSSTAVRPMFTSDVDGVYQASLVVNDGTLSSAADDVEITATQPNTPPTAHAGPDQHVVAGAVVTLDGTLSFDPDGDLITYQWMLVTVPTGSTAALTSPTASRPTFTADRPGVYTARLTVRDGQADGTPDDVVITAAPPNNLPVAHAGPDQSVVTGTLVTLDGSASYDPDSDPLTYQWSVVARPTGSVAAVTNPTSVSPTFTPDVTGEYVINLVVSDGTVGSAADIVVVVAEQPNAAPTANAGPNQTIEKGRVVTLDASGSFDPDGDPLTYAWTFVSIPTGSSAALANPTTVDPTFTADRGGDYVVRLVVNDGQGDSAPDAVVIVSVNDPPVAQAGDDQAARVEDEVALDGSGSSDPNGDTLTYAWTIASAPTGSTATLTNPTTTTPTFTPDVSGSYVISLVVNDGEADSPADDVVLTIRRRLVSLAVLPNGPSVPIAETLQLSATGTYSDGGSEDVTTTVTWASSDTSIATISATGLVSGLVLGTTTITALHDGVTSAPQTLSVLPHPPVISALTPLTGPAGTAVTISGDYFDPVAANNQVRFNGTAAIITSATSTAIQTTVPMEATTGPVTVTTSDGTGTSPRPFDVTLSTDFAVAVEPSTLVVLQGSEATAILSLSSTGLGAFTNLAALSVTGLPAGATALFEPLQLTGGQSGSLRILLDGTVPVGNTVVTISGTAQIDGQTVTHSASMTVSVVAGGQTSLVGQFLTVDGEPIAGVQVRLGTAQTNTDGGGNFLLADVPSGTQQLMIDVNSARAGYPIYAADVPLTAGETAVLPPFRITPPPAPERYTTISNATADQVFTDPRYPGLALTLPAGVTITGWDGNVKTQVALERVSPDRLAVLPPPASIRSFYQIFFGTPMGGVPSAPIPVTLPNDLELDPGEQAQIWYYDASPFGGAAEWKIAGLGTVSADGTQIIPNPGVGIMRFCGVCGIIGCSPAGPGNPPGNNPSSPRGGDPINLAIGQMIVEKTDLVLPSRLPLTIARTYSPFPAFNRDLNLGKGWTLSVDVAVLAPNTVLRRVVLPGNSRFEFVQQPGGQFTNSTHPLFAGAILTDEGSGIHRLRFKDGATWTFGDAVVAGFGLLIEQADRVGNRTTIERTSSGAINRIVDAAGRVTSVTYTGPWISQLTDPIGRTVQYSYDGYGRVTTVTDPDGGITTYTYDSVGRILTITDARGIQFIQNIYGPSGRVLRQIQADGSEWRFRYQLSGGTVLGPGCPGVGCPVEDSWDLRQAGYTVAGGVIVGSTVVDPEGHETIYRFSNSGFTTEVIDALGQSTITTYNPNNQTETTLDPLGRTTSVAFDASGDLLSVTDAAGNATVYVYEPTYHKISEITDALGHVTAFTYDAAGNLTSTTGPDGQVTSFTYDVFGQLLTVTDPLGNTTTFEYDDAGNLTASIDPLGNRTSRLYDAVSRLIAVTDPRGFTTAYTYDALNRVAAIYDAAGGVTRFTYDSNGNLLTVTDAKDQTTTYTYDAQDRLETRTDALNRSEDYTYDLNGNLTQFTDRKTQVSTFTYDGLNRRVQADYADGSRTTFTYDVGGRLVLADDSSSGQIDRSYDVLNRLTQELTPQGVVDYTYDVVGRRQIMTVNGQLPVTYGYDNASRLTSVAQGAQTVAIGYDTAGRRTTLTYPNGTNTSYGYDAASRLTSILHQDGVTPIESLGYAYDAAGNRVSLARAGQPATLLPSAVQAAYDAANQQIHFSNATPNLAYDANGNLVSQSEASDTTTYTWDARNRLVGLSGPGGSGSFAYDALGRRVIKTINGLATRYQYDGQDIVAEVDGTAVEVTYLRSLSVDEPFVRQGSVSEYYHTDMLGSVVRMTDGTGTSTVSYRYEAFGKAIVTGTTENSFQYTGRENDMTGLYYYRARYYAASFKRFLSEDPILSPFTPLTVGLCTINKTIWLLPQKLSSPPLDVAALNAYVYATSSPLQFRDNSGLEKERIERPCGQAVQRCLDDLLNSTIDEGRKQCYINTIGSARFCNDIQCVQAALYAKGTYCQGPLPRSCTDDIQNCSYQQDTPRRTD